MMTNSLNEKHEHATANLALFLTDSKSQAVGNKPSDEELAAFYDGQLDAVRRAQVQSFIANDKEVYGRWIRLLETAELMAPTETAASDTAAKSGGGMAVKTSFFDKLSEFFNSKGALAGASFAVAAVFVVVLQLQTPAPSLDELYGDFGGQLSDTEISLPTRSYDPFATPPEAGDIILSEGFYLGLLQLGKTDWFEDLHRYDHSYEESTAEFTEQEVRGLKELGAFAAISFAQCQIGNEAFISSAEPVLDGIVGNLGQADSVYIAATLNALTKALSAEDGRTNQSRICRAADAVLDKAH